MDPKLISMLEEARHARMRAAEWEAQANRLEVEVQLALAEQAARGTRTQQGGCPHPEEMRRDASAMGRPQFHCLQCGELVKLAPREG